MKRKKPTKRKRKPMSSKLTLVDKYPRKVLSEARNYGISFAFCKRDGDICTTVGPSSPCKDFLNDQVFSEATGKPFQAYGYHAKKEGIFLTKPDSPMVGYVAIYILPYFHGEKYKDQDKETKFMDDNYEQVAKFINMFEGLLKLSQQTNIEKVASNRFIAIIPYFWCQYTYLISLWSLLVRVGLESAFVSGDPMKVLEGCKTGDSMMVMTALPKLKKLIEGVIPKQDFTKGCSWHDEGIVSFEFPS